MDGPTETPRPRTVTAAGGLVLRGEGERTEVLVVHRPAYDDWTLPKGHVDPGEQLMTAAVREVEEETGVLGLVVSALGETAHPVGDTQKRVHWFLMRPDAGSPEPELRPPDDEVDTAAWCSLDEASQRLTYRSERELLAAATTS
jgi:8-oxo-dGTP diphosphatase